MKTITFCAGLEQSDKKQVLKLIDQVYFNDRVTNRLFALIDVIYYTDLFELIRNDEKISKKTYDQVMELITKIVTR